MRTAKMVTHILLPLLLGLIVVGLIGGSPAVWITGIALLVLDITVGVVLQYLTDNVF